jgi:hypothetical protein
MDEKVSGGKNLYGEVIGIVVLKRFYPRLPGDIGNASTFDFPVRLHVAQEVDRSTRWKVFAGDREMLEPFLRAVKQLEQEGVKAVTSACGFLVQFQDIIADAVNIPVFMSSLLQIPLVYRMLRKDQMIGVITIDASPRGLGKKAFEAAGAADIPIVVTGLEDSEAFNAIAEDREIMYPKKMEFDIVEHAKKLVKENPKVGAIVLECHNLPPWAKAIQDAVNLPVFDIYTLTNWVYSALVRKNFKGIM